jgi:hypothetical protein
MLNSLIEWSNENSGFVSVLIFALTLFLGWISGIFGALRRKPEFKLRVIPGPTLCTTFATGQKYEGYDIHRTAISVYLGISNVGSAPASIENVSLAYHWHLSPFSWNWLKYRIGWYWIEHPIITMDDFQYDFGDRVKIYPSLFQGSHLIGKDTDTYLNTGQSVNGVVYFEQTESWGGFFPTPNKGAAKIRIAVHDSFGKKHVQTFRIPIVSLDEARKYNPSFGGTFELMRKDATQNQEAPNNPIEERRG